MTVLQALFGFALATVIGLRPIQAVERPQEFEEARQASLWDAKVASVTRQGQITKVELMCFSGGKADQGTWQRGMKREGIFSVEWDESRGPAPVGVNQEVQAYVSSKRELLMIVYGASARFWRTAKDGKIEIAVNPDNDTGKPQLGLLLLKPTGLQQGSTYVHWFPRSGVFLFEEEAGDANIDPTAFGKAGIPIRNVPDLRIYPGKDGWRAATHEPEGYWKNCPPVPKDQETAGAG